MSKNRDVDVTLQDDGSATATVTLESHPGWRFDVEVDGIGSMPVLRSLKVSGGGAVTTRLLASLPTGELVRLVAEEAAAVTGAPATGHMGTSPAHASPFVEWAEQLRAGRRRGRKDRPDALYAALAVEYEEIANHSPTPTKDMSARHGVSVRRLQKLLTEASYRGLFVRGRKGQAGRATDIAREMLTSGGA